MHRPSWSTMRSRPAAGIGQLGARLALAFIAVALAAIAVNAVVFALIFGSDIGSGVDLQENGLASTAALTAAAGFRGPGWADADLTPLFQLAERAGTAVQVRGNTGRVIGSSPRFASYTSDDAHTTPVIVRGRAVGHV